MCLTVKRSFVKNPIPVAYCWKYLEKPKYSRHWQTPYQHIPIPKDGILIPSIPANQKREFLKEEDILGGYIHAYTNKDDILDYTICFPKQTRYGKMKLFKAIATNILAIGNNNDLICEALYIPELDLTIKS